MRQLRPQLVGTTTLACQHPACAAFWCCGTAALQLPWGAPVRADAPGSWLEVALRVLAGDAALNGHALRLGHLLLQAAPALSERCSQAQRPHKARIGNSHEPLDNHALQTVPVVSERLVGAQPPPHCCQNTATRLRGPRCCCTPSDRFNSI